MKFKDHGRILYVSMADVTLPNGPGVNEREFLLSLYERLGDRMRAVVPKPLQECAELDPSRTFFYRNPRRWDLVGFLSQQLQLHSLVRRLHLQTPFDLIVVRLSVLPLAFYSLCRKPIPFAIKTLGEVQGFTQNRGVKGVIAKIAGPANGHMFRSIVSQAIAIDCCTETHFHEHMRDYQMSPGRLLVVQNATNVKRFRPGDPNSARKSLGLDRFQQVIGFVGGSPVDRGGMQMLELAVRLREHFPRLGVVIVGRDSAGVLRRRATELGVEDRAVITGEISYEDVPAFVNCFDLGIALDRPSRWQLTGNSYQKVRQYLACGKPAVTCIDPDSELVREGLVHSVTANDLESIESAVRRILSRSSAVRDEFSERAARFARAKLSTEVSLDQRLEFWERRLAESVGSDEARFGRRAA